MSRTAEDWSHTLTQAYLALRQGRTAEAASVFAKVSIKAPAEIAKVARLEIKTRFLNDLVRNDESDAAFVFERVIDACFPQVNGHDKELFRQASRIVLSDLEQQGKVVLLGPLFMTKYAFQQKKLKLIGLLSQKERRTLEWSKALEFMVGSSRADLVGKHEWKKAARLLREGGVLSCSSDRVKLGCSMSPLDLVHEWMSLTRRPVRQGTPLTQAIGHKATLDRMMLEKASADPRFVLLREYLWLSTLMDEIESKWLDALRTGETGQHLTLWLGGEFKGHRENRAWRPPKEFCSYLESRLAQIAQDSGYRRIGAAIWADKERFFAHIGVWSKRLKKAEVSMRQIREDLGLKGSAVHGSVWWHIRRRMNEAGFTRMGDRFWHAARIQDAVRVLIGSGTPEPLGWNELMSALRERHKIEIRQQELKRLLEQDLSVVCAAEGVFLRERQATVCQVKHSAEIAVGDTGYASNPQICEQVKKDWGKVATPSTIDVALCTDKLYTHIHGGWALAPEFDWIWAIRAQMAPSEPGAWADGVIGWVPDESESSLVTDTWHEGRGALLQAATLLVTGQDVSNSRLRIYPCLRELFPNARFVALFRGPDSVEAVSRGDQRAGVIQFPLGFMSSLGLQHADEVKIVRLGGWPPVYEIVPTGKFDPTMRDSGKQIAERFVTAARGETGLQTLVDAVLETAGCAMSVCEISDALALCSCRPGYRVLREHLRKYTYYRRVADGRYLICVGRRRQYQLRIADLEDRVRSIKQDLRKAETMVLALRSENAKLKTENRGFRQRVSGLELERLRITESLSLSSTNVERLNQQLREAERRVQDLDERLRQSEHLADELMLHNRRLQTELRRPVWRVVLDSIIKLFGGASTGGSLSA